jgi:hypothetical protein
MMPTAAWTYDPIGALARNDNATVAPFNAHCAVSMVWAIRLAAVDVPMILTADADPIGAVDGSCWATATSSFAFGSMNQPSAAA